MEHFDPKLWIYASVSAPREAHVKIPTSMQIFTILISYLWQCMGVIIQVMESISLSLGSLGLVSDNVQSILEVQESEVIFFLQTTRLKSVAYPNAK